MTYVKDSTDRNYVLKIVSFYISEGWTLILNYTPLWEIFIRQKDSTNDRDL